MKLKAKCSKCNELKDCKWFETDKTFLSEDGKSHFRNEAICNDCLKPQVFDKQKFLNWLNYWINESNVDGYVDACEDIKERVLNGDFDTTK